jgi:hypothetical protein
LHDIISSNYIGLLNEYNVGPATLENTISIGYEAGPQTLSEGDIQNTIVGWINQALLPIPDQDETNLLFLLFVPSAVTLTLDGVSQNDPKNGFAGYHNWGMFAKVIGKNNLFYAVICWSGSVPVMTFVASHELAEAFTDRSGNGWYSDDVQVLFWGGGREIADICTCPGGQALQTAGGSIVCSYWRNSVGRCLQQSDLTPTASVVPDVVTDRLSPSEAKQSILSAGFVYSQTDDPVEGNFQPYAEDQNPNAGILAPLGTTVTVLIAIPHRGPLK